MIAEVRQKTILDYILTKEEVSVQELSTMFGVSEMTIRRDLVKLEQLGLVRRTYGGAIPAGQNTDVPVDVRSSENQHLKTALGKLCATLVAPGDTIFMDAGTTMMEVARHLPEDLGITVVTNAIPVVNVLVNKPGIEVLVLGGPLQHTPQLTIGSAVTETIKSLHVNRSFITATGFSVQHGLTDANIQQSEVKRLMAQSSKIRTLVIDSSKYDVRAFNRFAEFTDFDQLVVDDHLDSEVISQIKATGIEVIIAPTTDTLLDRLHETLHK
ncbi:DeoR/GlpR family DNA-binding transcription regulator [Alicyclobacillus acidiphilus]|uniref:DeoR/GlpR family DNA-binding transcription regulator n=1 Tax=Alicyclobacillus acidiphilus TaxID=182455 RepID=UPI0008373FC5|nr:DeoR/GlpR family DNA-binding transcription regulator [Alicyclobacillus acidiphilus]